MYYGITPLEECENDYIDATYKTQKGSKNTRNEKFEWKKWKEKPTKTCGETTYIPNIWQLYIFNFLFQKWLPGHCTHAAPAAAEQELKWTPATLAYFPSNQQMTALHSAACLALVWPGVTFSLTAAHTTGVKGLEGFITVTSAQRCQMARINANRKASDRGEKLNTINLKWWFVWVRDLGRGVQVRNNIWFIKLNLQLIRSWWRGPYLWYLLKYHRSDPKIT